MPAEFAPTVPGKQQQPGSTIPVKILGACAALLIATMVYNSLGGWQAQSHGQRNAREAALPLQRRIRKSRFARQDDPDSPSEVMVETLVARDGKGLGKGRGKGKGKGKGKGRGQNGIAEIYANQPATLFGSTKEHPLLRALPPPPPPGLAVKAKALSPVSNGTGFGKPAGQRRLENASAALAVGGALKNVTAAT